MNDAAIPMNEDGINLTITETEIPPVSKDSTLSNSANGIKLASKAADQELLAKTAVIKQAIAMMNIGVVYGTKFLTEDRVSNEAAISTEEAEALAAVWAPLITVASPLTIAIITTGGIITAKAVMIMKLNEDRKKEENDSERNPRSDYREPADESGSESTSTIPSESIGNSDNRITGGLPAFDDVVTTITGNGTGDSGLGERIADSPELVPNDDLGSG